MKKMGIRLLISKKSRIFASGKMPPLTNLILPNMKQNKFAIHSLYIATKVKTIEAGTEKVYTLSGMRYINVK